MSGAAGVARKSEREGHFHRGAVGASPLAFEAHRVGGCNRGLLKSSRIRLCVCTFQQKHGKPLVTFEKAMVERSEQDRKAVAAELLRFGDRQKLDEKSGKLDDMIMRAPRVAVARADRETKAPVKLGGGVEIAHRMGDVIKAARHQ